MSRFGHTLNDFQMCFWPPKVHDLKNFFENKSFLTFLNRKNSIFTKFVMCYTSSQIFMDNMFYRINKC